MKVKATVILDVGDVKTWEDAYSAVYSFCGHAVTAWNGRKFSHAYFEKVFQVEGIPADTAAPAAEGEVR